MGEGVDADQHDRGNTQDPGEGVFARDSLQASAMRQCGRGAGRGASAAFAANCRKACQRESNLRRRITPSPRRPTGRAGLWIAVLHATVPSPSRWCAVRPGRVRGALPSGPTDLQSGNPRCERPTRCANRVTETPCRNYSLDSTGPSSMRRTRTLPGPMWKSSTCCCSLRSACVGRFRCLR